MSGRGRGEQTATPSEEERFGAEEPQPGLNFQAGCVVVGKVLKLEQEVGPLVDFPSNSSGSLVPARSTVPLQSIAVGQEVVLVFDEGDPGRPIIVGALQTPVQDDIAAATAPSPAIEASSDQPAILLSAEREIVLRCGQASIVLTRAGKILIRGEYVLSRASGANRIRGGSVQIN